MQTAREESTREDADRVVRYGIDWTSMPDFFYSFRPSRFAVALRLPPLCGPACSRACWSFCVVLFRLTGYRIPPFPALPLVCFP